MNPSSLLRFFATPRSLLFYSVASIYLLASFVFSQTQPTTSPVIDEAKLESLIARLSADDWRDRESATKELASLGPAAAPRLNQLLADTKDEEVRNRVAMALKLIADGDALGQSRITLHLKAATAEAAFAEVARQSHVPPFLTNPANLFETFAALPADIDLEGVNYFAAMSDLADKFGVRLIDSGTDRRLAQARVGNVGQLAGPKVFSGPFMLTCNSLSRQSSVVLREPGPDGDMRGGGTDYSTINLTLAAEPKISFASHQVNRTLDECVDDRGTVIKLSDRNSLYGLAGHSLPIALSITKPSNDATMLTRLRGSMEVQIVTRFDTFETDDLTTAMQSKPAGGKTFTLKSFKTMSPGVFAMVLSVAGAGQHGCVRREPESRIGPTARCRRQTAGGHAAEHERQRQRADDGFDDDLPQDRSERRRNGRSGQARLASADRNAHDDRAVRLQKYPLAEIIVGLIRRKRVMKKRFAGLACAAMAAGIALAQTSPTTSTSVPATQPASAPSTAAATTAPVDSTKLDALINQLNDDDWRKRESATKEIVALGIGAKPRLVQLVAETKDEEVRTRASTAIAQIDDNKLIGPSVITIKGTNMTAERAFAELSRQAEGPTFTTQPPNLFRDMSIKPTDLDLDGVSYFDALATLCEKYGVYMQEFGNEGLVLYRGRMQGQNDGLKASSGPFRLSCNCLNRLQNVSFRGGGDPAKAFSSESLNAQMMLQVEPKIRLAQRTSKIVLDECVDDQDRPIKQSQNGSSYYGGSTNLPVNLSFDAPAADAKAIKHLKGRIEVNAVVRTEKIEVTDFAAVKDRSKVVAGRNCTVNSVKVNGNDCVVVLSVTGLPLDQNGYEAFFNEGVVDLLDANGKELRRSGSSSSYGDRLGTGTISYRRGDGEDGVGEPVKLVWKLPGEIRMLSVPFDWSDLPMPRYGK